MSKPLVVLLHGLARTRRSMSRLARALREAGYETWCLDYPSRRLPLSDLVDDVRSTLHREVGGRPIHGVTHSMGGIIARHLAGDFDWQKLVMLAPPNSGSQVARTLTDNAAFRWFFGPAGQDVGNPSGWPAPPTPFGVIAGTGGASPLNPPSLLLKAMGVFERGEAHDGTVAVAETRLDGMADFATVDATHTFIMNNPHARELVLRFLRRGTFSAP